MRSPESGFPARLCFSNHDLARGDCKNCELAEPCRNEQAGYTLSHVLNICAQDIETENLRGGLPDWVFVLDRIIISDEDWETIKNDYPKLFREYMKFNGIPEG